MKKVIDLLEEAVAMGFDRDEALEAIDASLDQAIGFKNRQSIEVEEIDDDIYETILFSFECEKE